MSVKANNVLCAPLLDPGMGRKEIEAPHGLTIAEIVALALPGFRDPRKGLRVMLVTDRGASVVDPAYWSSLRPMPHARVVIRTIPGKDALRSVLLAVVSIAAAALAPYLFPTLGKVGLALATSGLTVLGQLL
ncbi:phage tail protein, partial [Sulfitobacter sp. G21635-S1]|nr:phage tail protein [Sulfitobacter sp. G21635-S1]